MKYTILVLSLMSSLAYGQANDTLSNLGTTSINTDLNFSAIGGTRSITTGAGDSLVLQTSSGGGVVVNSDSSILLQAGGNGNMLLSTTNADIDIISGGEVVEIPAPGHWVDLYGDGVFVGSSYGLQLAPASAAPACNSSFAGTLYYAGGVSGVADQLQVCMKASDDSYSWKNVIHD